MVLPGCVVYRDGLEVLALGLMSYEAIIFEPLGEYMDPAPPRLNDKPAPVACALLPPGPCGPEETRTPLVLRMGCSGAGHSTNGRRGVALAYDRISSSQEHIHQADLVVDLYHGG